MSNAPSLVKPSALDALRALGGKKPVQASSPMAAQVNDPAIAGARKDKNTVILGLDLGIAERAREAAQLKDALERATGEFTVIQGEMRDYGRDKRALYNDTFKADVTTVKVPYEVDCPDGSKEKRYVSVICSNKYSVAKEVVLGNREAFGPAYDRLFIEERVKSLKPNAEELIRGVFEQVGLTGDELETAMDSLFQESVSVKTAEDFEKESKKLAPDLQKVLEQAVTRSQPGLKF